MNSETTSDFLVLSRGQWDASLAPEQIQTAIDHFYEWYNQGLATGRMKPGQRLARAGKLVSKQAVIDGPFTEAKEIVGGYWFIVAKDLDEAAAIARENPCIACGLMLEVRQVDLTRASALDVTNETPPR